MLSPAEIAELKEYYKANNFEKYPSQMQEVVEYLLQNPDIEIPPVCVPSYKRRPSAAFLTSSIEHGFQDKVIVYCYEMEEELYKDFPNRVLVPNSVRTESKYPLATKLNFMVQDQEAKGHSEIFRIDDDIFNLSLPVSTISKSGNLVNGKYKCSYNLVFHVWYAMHKYLGLDASALMYNTDFTFWNITKKLTMPHMQLCAACLIPTKYRYDEQQGWEDVDYQLNLFRMNCKTAGIPIMMQTPGYMRNLTTMDYSNDRLSEMRRSVETLVKWGPKVVFPQCKTFTNWTIGTNWRFIDKHGVNADTVTPLNLTKENYADIEFISKAMLDPKDRQKILKWFFDEFPDGEEVRRRVKECQDVYEETPTNNMIKYGDTERGQIIFSLSFGNKLPDKAIKMFHEYRAEKAEKARAKRSSKND